jgi:dolichol-phosphate mannosyltransferase
VQRTSLSGFGRAVRAGLQEVTGDVVVVYMADRSDDPEDVIAYYRKIVAGYDCVFGSRFVSGGRVERYPPARLVLNRVVNRALQILFWTRFNDLTNAFKAYRVEVLRDCSPFRACHFDLSLEMALAALIRGYRIAQVPVRWYGRTQGQSSQRVGAMSRRYLYTCLSFLLQRALIRDDLVSDRGREERFDPGF